VDSLDVFEIIPIEYDRGKKVIHYYSQIKVKKLTATKIRDLYRNANFKSLPMVLSIKNFFLITYQPKPPILISKINGRLYSFLGNWDIQEVQHQASLVIRVLSTYDLVKEHKRKTVRRRKCK